MSPASKTFVRSAVRMPVEIKTSLARTARQQYRSFCEVLEARRVYSRFEFGPDDSLQCVFSPKPGLLLGETVRDWLADTQTPSGETLQHFLWCEQLAEDELALVYVLDGRVHREAFAMPSTARMEVRQLVQRGLAHDPQFRIFLHGLTQAEVGIEPGQEVSVLESSVLDHLKKARRPLPQLSSYGAAIARIATGLRVRQILITGFIVAAVALPATWYAARWYHLADIPVAVSHDPEVNRQLVQEYHDLLGAADPGEVLPALHRATAQFLADPVFGAYWKIEELQWSRGTSRLHIRATLSKGSSILEEEGLSMNEARQARLVQAARAHGWELTLNRYEGTFLLPLEWSPRPQDAIRGLYRPLSSEHPWHPERLSSDLAWVGAPELGRGNARNAVYQTQALGLELSRDPWVTGETAGWLARRLRGGPVSLDSVSLRSVSDGAGGLMSGTIQFSLVWRNPG